MSNEMYYPRFTKVIIHNFMLKDPSIPRRNKFSALLPIELTNEDIKNSNAYKEYHAVATGVTPPKPKASVWNTRSSSDTTITPPTAAVGLRLTTFEKGKQAAKASKAKSLSALSKMKELVLYQGFPMYPLGDDDERKDGDSDDDGDDGEKGDDDDDDEDNNGEEGNNGDDDQEDEGDDKEDDEEEGGDDEQPSNKEEFIHPSLSTHTEEEPRDEESFDPIPKTPKDTDDEGNSEENLSINVGREEEHDEEEEEDELYRDVNINQGRGMESIFETTSQMDVQTPTSMAPLPMFASTITPSTITTITTAQQAPLFPTTAPSTLLQDLPNFCLLFRFDHRLKANFSKFMQTNQFAEAISAILGIVQRYMDQRMNEAVKVAVQIQSDRLYDEAQANNDEFLKTIDKNMQKIIKEQVKEQVKVQVSKILPKIEQTVNEQLEAELLTWSSNSSKTSYYVAADLSEMELKILIEKIKGNKSIHRSNEQRNLYKALVKAYESDKIILDTYGDTITLKRRRDDDADRDKEPSVGSDRGSKRCREGKEPESASAPMEKATGALASQHKGLNLDRRVVDQPIVQSSHHPEWFSQQQKPPTPDRDWNKTLPATYRSIQPWIRELAKQSDSRSSFDELMDTPVDFFAFLMTRLRVDTLTLKLLAGPTYEIMMGSIVIQRRVEDLQLGVESYQKKLNLTKPNTYRSDLKRKEAYIAYSNPRGFIYHNKDKKNRLMQIDKLHKFSDGMLTDVHTALDDRLKGIRMQVISSSDDEALDKEDTSNHRRIDEIDVDKDIALMLIDTDVDATQVTTAIADILVSAAETIVTTAPTITAESTKINVEVQEKGKRKAKLIEELVKLKKKDQILFDEEVARKVQEEIYEQERLIGEKARQKEEANKEQEQLTDAKKAKLFMEFIEKRRKFFAIKRTIEKWNKPSTKAHHKSIMSTYLKNKDGWKPRALKNKSFTEIKELFDKAMKRINNFIDFRTELVEVSKKKDKAETAQERSSKRVGDELDQKRSKKQKVKDDKESEELKKCL
nr:hypothetical protein [Tanacetum cinerariifolium]